MLYIDVEGCGNMQASKNRALASDSCAPSIARELLRLIEHSPLPQRHKILVLLVMDLKLLYHKICLTNSYLTLRHLANYLLRHTVQIDGIAKGHCGLLKVPIFESVKVYWCIV
jgi:hypothetical protein